jgi:hypothetical protein
MAKKRRKQQQEKEEKEYKPPAFDKKEFMETEISVAKGTIIAVILALPMAMVALLLTDFSAVIGLLVGLSGFGLIWFLLPMIGIEVTSFKITHWLGVISSYFFLFLAIWVILCNPPFSDKALPDIGYVRVSWDGRAYVDLNESETGNSVNMPAVNVTQMRIQAQVTDNVELNVNTVRIQLYDGTPEAMSQNATYNYIFEFLVNDPTPGMSFTISAQDTNGHSNSYSFALVT